MPRDLTGKTIMISGGSRGIGLAIALAAAQRGANIGLLAKTAVPDPRILGTIYSAAAQIEEVGGRAVPVVGDVRSEADVAAAVGRVADEFGGIDICINNASAIDLSNTADLSHKKADLIMSVNAGGTWGLTKECLPDLCRAEWGHVLTLSPPLNLAPKWLGAHPNYTVSKYAMTMLTLGWAEEYADTNVSFTCLWPETLIDTAAVRNVVGGSDHARSPQIMADAAIAILETGTRYSGRTMIDAEVLAETCQTNLTEYGGGHQPQLDLFVDDYVATVRA